MRSRWAIEMLLLTEEEDEALGLAIRTLVEKRGLFEALKGIREISEVPSAEDLESIP